MKKIMLKISDFLLLIGVFMIILSVALSVNNLSQATNAGKKATEIAEKFTTAEKNYLEDGCTVKRVNGHNYVGLIAIPAVDICLPVMSDIQSGELKIAPCRYYGDVKTEDMVIAGHNYKTHFGKLKNLKINDDVYFIDVENLKTEYTVCSIEVLSANDVKSMINEEYPLTLFTCTLSGNERYTVRCSQKYCK